MLAVQQHPPVPPPGSARGIAAALTETVCTARETGPRALIKLMAQRMLFHAGRDGEAHVRHLLRDGFTLSECNRYGIAAREHAGALVEAAEADARDEQALAAVSVAGGNLPTSVAALDTLQAELAAIARHLATIDAQILRLREGLGPGHHRGQGG